MAYKKEYFVCRVKGDVLAGVAFLVRKLSIVGTALHLCKKLVPRWLRQ